MKITGIARIRNEEGVIEHTLEHLSDKIDDIYIIDDCSTDNTVEICKSFPNVISVMSKPEWESRPIERLRLEGEQRQELLLKEKIKQKEALEKVKKNKKYSPSVGSGNKNLSAKELNYKAISELFA